MRSLGRVKIEPDNAGVGSSFSSAAETPQGPLVKSTFITGVRRMNISSPPRAPVQRANQHRASHGRARHKGTPYSRVCSKLRIATAISALIPECGLEALMPICSPRAQETLVTRTLALNMIAGCRV